MSIAETKGFKAYVARKAERAKQLQARRCHSCVWAWVLLEQDRCDQCEGGKQYAPYKTGAVVLPRKEG